MYLACIYGEHSLLLQQILREDEKKSKDIPIFLGFSRSGVVEGDVVYANFGTEEDFRKLKVMGVSVKNKIVLVRQGRVFRGNKVCTMPTYLNKSNDLEVLRLIASLKAVSVT